MASWYDPLPRSVSARPYLHSPPCERLPHRDDHSFVVEDPAITGSFVRLLHRKKSLSPSPVHQQHGDHHAHIFHSHTCHHHHAHAESKKHPHTSYCNHEDCTIEDSDDFGASSQLQQLQLANLSSTYKKKLGKRDDILATKNHATQQIEDVAGDGPSFRYYQKHSPPLQEDTCSMVEHIGGDGGCDGDDDQMHIDDSDITDGGLRQRRKSRFAPRPRKAHHGKTKSTEKSLSFNISLDDGLTEQVSPAWPGRNMLEEQSIPLKKRKDSLEFLASNRCLDGLEEQLRSKLCDKPGSNTKHVPRIEGFSEVESLDVIECNDLSVGKESSAFNADIPGGSQLNTPFRSPARSPTMSSLKSSSSPLFDPSILAAFEEAVESVRYSAPDDDWTLVNDASNEPSSLSSSDKFTWVSSEPSSDGESARHSDEIFASNLHEMSYAAFLHEESDNKRQKVDGMFSGLDRFELRCPPKGEDKIVLYFTSLRGVRKTYQDCCALRLILQGLGVDVDERDVWMHLKFREELADLLGERGLPIPRLFIKGRYIGGVEEVKQLHEDGLLVRLIEDLPTFGKFRKSCDGCADMRFIPCLTCSGSCKLLDDDLDEMVKCFECNENGLIMCPMCSSC